MRHAYHVSPPFLELASYLGTISKGEDALVKKSLCQAQLPSGCFPLSVPFPLTPSGFHLSDTPPLPHPHFA